MSKSSAGSHRRIILAGANPGLRLFDENGKVTAYASIWMVDWSIRGAGTAVVLWFDGIVRVVSEDVDLAAWLERYFVRSFLEVQGLPWHEPAIERDLVQVSMNLADGLSAKAADIQIEMGGVLDRRLFATDNFQLADGQPQPEPGDRPGPVRDGLDRRRLGPRLRPGRRLTRQARLVRLPHHRRGLAALTLCLTLYESSVGRGCRWRPKRLSRGLR